MIRVFAMNALLRLRQSSETTLSFIVLQRATFPPLLNAVPAMPAHNIYKIRFNAGSITTSCDVQYIKRHSNT